jgi:alcohol dehydrogenase class IV
MPWTFSHRTELLVGPGCWREAVPRVAAFGRQVLLVTGARSLDRLGIGAELNALLTAAACAVTRVVVSGEPDTAVADGAAASARAAGCDVVLGFGGGSALDVAKAAAALAVNGGGARAYLEGLPQPPRTLAHEPLPVVCVPTTAGTGSEVTRNSVLTVPDLRVKRSLRDVRLLPRLACIDATLSAAAPANVRAGCAFDALTHLVESFCSAKASPASDALARDGIPRALHGLRALAAGAATTAHGEDLAWASTLGGMCLGNAGLGAAHGLVAPLGGLHPAAPHGAALACLLPPTLVVNAAALAARAPGHPAMAKLDEVARWITGGAAPITAAAATLVGLRRRCGLPGLAAYGVGDAAPIAAAPSGSLGTNPVPLTRQELERIVEEALA